MNEPEASSRYRTEIPDIQFWMDMIPCQAACPVHTDAGRYVQLIAAGNFERRATRPCGTCPCCAKAASGGRGAKRWR